MVQTIKSEHTCEERAVSDETQIHASHLWKQSIVKAHTTKDGRTSEKALLQ